MNAVKASENNTIRELSLDEIDMVSGALSVDPCVQICINVPLVSVCFTVCA